MYIIIPPLRLKLLYSESNKDDNHRRRSIHAVVHVSKVRRDDIPAVERVPIAGRHGGLLAHRRDRQVTGLRVLRQHRELFNLADQFPFLPSFLPSFLPFFDRSLALGNNWGLRPFLPVICTEFRAPTSTNRLVPHVYLPLSNGSLHYRRDRAQ